MLLFCFSCSSAETKLKVQIKLYSTELPQDLGDGLRATDADYRDGVVTLTYTAEDEIVSAVSFASSTLGSVYLQTFKAAMAEAVNQDSDMKDMFELLVEAQAKLKILFVSKSSGRETSFTLSKEDVQDILQGKVSLEDEEEALLDEDDDTESTIVGASLMAEISAFNAMCPYQIDEMTIVTGMKLEGNSVVYLYSLDEDYVSAAEVLASYSQVKAALRANMPQARDLVELCVASQKSLVYRYIGSASGEVVNISFSLSELTSLL